jgi:hypothetical protein
VDFKKLSPRHRGNVRGLGPSLVVSAGIVQKVWNSVPGGTELLIYPYAARVVPFSLQILGNKWGHKLARRGIKNSWRRPLRDAVLEDLTDQLCQGVRSHGFLKPRDPLLVQ